MTAKKERFPSPIADGRTGPGKSRSQRRSQKTILNIASAAHSHSEENLLEHASVMQNEEDAESRKRVFSNPNALDRQPPSDSTLLRCVLPTSAVLATANRMALCALKAKTIAEPFSHRREAQQGTALELQAEVLSLFNDHAPNSHITDRLNHSASNSPAVFLQDVLKCLEFGEVQTDDQEDPEWAGRNSAISQLRSTIHTCMQALSHQVRFQDAVHQAATEAVYHFAYGLTHEINNPLANIAARAQQLIPSIARESDRSSLATIVDQSMRAHEMLAEMMRVVKPAALPLHPTDVTGLIRTVVDSYATKARAKRITYQSTLLDRNTWVSANAIALTEALHAIAKNALEVCRPTDQITWTCEVVESSRNAPSTERRITATHCLRIALQDSGPGMTREAEEHAWDLYYSGREHGRGLGISLASVRRIIDAHNGLVWIRSSSNVGCTVEIRLPLLPTRSPARRTLAV